MSTILMVDDDILFLQAIEKQIDFTQIGFDQCFTATDTVQATQILMEKQVDVMLCDIEMPGKTGLDLIRWLADEKYPVIVILLTCHSSFDYAKEAIQLNVFDYLLKPIRVEVLEDRLRQALAKRDEVSWLNVYRKEKSKKSRSTEKSRPAERSRSGEKDPILRIQNYIKDNIHTELTREQLGRALFMNPDYIARIFREKQGQSLNDYIRNCRIERAKELLSQTDLPLSDICNQIGYSYNTYFFNTFKKVTGVSPSDYRSQSGK